jgi:biopolymer transport protein ExbB
MEVRVTKKTHCSKDLARYGAALAAMSAAGLAATRAAAQAIESGVSPGSIDGAIPTASLWDTFVAGGPLMIPIGVCSFLLLLVMLERLIILRRKRIIPRLFVERLLLQIGEGAIDRNEALERCEDDSSLTAEVFAAAIRKWGKSAVEVEQAVLDAGERAANQLRRFLRLINCIATVSPLLGLLGTVSGMIQAFNDIAGSNAMGRAELLAGGIGTALITTAAGLCVAIPALILYMYFVARVDSLVTEIDRQGQELVQLISAEGIEDRRNRPPRAKSKKAA